MSENSGLKSDEKRDASDSIAGYAYQIYQSIFAWMQLNETELLFLEGAEDFDIQAENNVETIQVKKRLKNITLRSSEVIDAINNFWGHRSQNSQYKIKFRFLSTADYGIERKSPIPDQRAGIEYWESVEKDLDLDTQPLKELLLSLDISDDLKKFIENSSDDEFRNNLVSKFSWDLRAKPLDALESSIKESLIIHGNKLRILPDDSSATLSNLFDKIASKLSSKDKSPLKKTDFLEAFQDAATIRISKGKICELISGSSSLLISSSSSLISKDPMPIVKGSSSRKTLVQTQTKILKNEQILFIHGSSGLGKTNITSQIADYIKGNWKYIGLRGIKPDEVQKTLKLVYVGVQEKDIEPLLIIDDLDFTQLRQFEQELIKLVFLVRKFKGLILITCPHCPPDSLLLKLWLDGDVIFEIPYMDEEEIKDVILQHGLSDQKSATDWARVVKLLSSGHPQLVHARVRSQSQKGWESLTNEDLIFPEDFEEVRQNFRRYLTDELDTDEARQFLYRLSLITSSFSRKTALAVAECSPSIPFSRDIFDQLIGPWIENEGNNQYKVSPLLIGAANGNLNKTEIMNVHESISRSILSTGSVDQDSLLPALMHAIFGQASRDVLKLSGEIIKLTDEQIESLAHVTDIITQIGVDGKKILPNHPDIEILFRLAQFKIASVKNNNSKALNLTKVIFDLLEDIDDETQKQLISIMAYSQILGQIRVPLSPKITIPLIFDFKNLLQTTDEMEDIVKSITNCFPEAMGINDNDIEKAFFAVELVRIDGIDHLNDIVNELKKLNDDERGILISIFKFHFDFAEEFTGRAWFEEVRKKGYDTEHLIDVFDNLTAAAQGWCCEELIIASSIAKSVILAEYMDKREQALQIIENQLNEYSDDIFLLNQKSKILFDQDDKVGASIIFDRIWNNTELPEITNVSMLRLAGINASNLKEFSKAVKYFNHAAECIENGNNSEPRAIGFHAESALCHWINSDNKKSLEKFKKVVEELEKITVNDELIVHNLFATVGLAILWLYREVSEFGEKRDEDILLEPRIGMFSDPEPHEDITQYGIRDTHTLWEILSYIEQNLQLNLSITKKYEAFNIKPTVEFEVTQRIFRLRQCWETSDFHNLISRSVTVLECFVYLKIATSKNNIGLVREVIPALPNDFWNHQDNLRQILCRVLGASLVLIMQKPEEKLPLEQWIYETKNNGIPDQEFIEVLEVLEGKPAKTDAYQFAATSIFYLRTADKTPRGIWEAYFRLLNIFANWHGEEGVVKIDETLNYLCVRDWLFSSLNQGFLFSNPREICPKIETICNDQSLTGISRIATILEITARPLNLNLAPDCYEFFEKAKMYTLQIFQK